MSDTRAEKLAFFVTDMQRKASELMILIEVDVDAKVFWELVTILNRGVNETRKNGPPYINLGYVKVNCERIMPEYR